MVSDYCYRHRVVLLQRHSDPSEDRFYSLGIALIGEDAVRAGLGYHIHVISTEPLLEVPDDGDLDSSIKTGDSCAKRHLQ